MELSGSGSARDTELSVSLGSQSGMGRFHWAIALHLKAQLVKLVMWLLLGEGGAATESLGLSVTAPASAHSAQPEAEFPDHIVDTGWDSLCPTLKEI